VLVGKTRLAPTRESLGATAYLWGAIGRALSAAPGSDVKVVVAVKGAAVRAYVKRIAERYDRKPVGAKLRLRHLKPFVTKERPGQRLLRVKAVAAIVAALKANDDETAFRVATGQRIYPTPLGRFEIVTKWRNPWWYPPDSDWAKGEKPVPPGPGNPLGTRWMGISSPGVGIHGTPDAASLGYSASHGCIRMAIPQAEWLFEHVEIGTPVYIVAA
jgi:lipoprotein-anchoring transpeptidase ErfK/SrfK